MSRKMLSQRACLPDRRTKKLTLNVNNNKLKLLSRNKKKKMQDKQKIFNVWYYILQHFVKLVLIFIFFVFVLM